VIVLLTVDDSLYSESRQTQQVVHSNISDTVLHAQSHRLVAFALSIGCFVVYFVFGTIKIE